jgi:hypothetical protein
LSSNQTRNANILVKVRPVDALATPDETPLRTLTGRAMSEPRVPGKRNSQGTTIIQINDERVARDLDVLG